MIMMNFSPSSYRFWPTMQGRVFRSFARTRSVSTTSVSLQFLVWFLLFKAVFLTKFLNFQGAFIKSAAKKLKLETLKPDEIVVGWIYLWQLHGSHSPSLPRSWVETTRGSTRRILSSDTSLGRVFFLFRVFWFLLNREVRCLFSTDAGSMGLDSPRTQTVLIVSFPSNSWKFMQQVGSFLLIVHIMLIAQCS